MNNANVAVIGGGVAGLTAAYLLRNRYEVTLFESATRLGGHADTRRVRTPDGTDLSLDTAFLVHNRSTYPYFSRLLDELGVRTGPSEMSMSFRCRECGLEYAGGKHAAGLWPVGGMTVRARYVRMLTELPRFHRTARALMRGQEVPVSGGSNDDLTLRDVLRGGRYSRYFADHYVVPLIGAVWSADPLASLDYPARYVFRFLHQHGLLSVRSTHQWRHVVGGSRHYVDRITEKISAPRPGVTVRAVHRHADGVSVTADDGITHLFDRVVLATHADQALALLADPSPVERQVLGAFTYSRNTMLLHTDATQLPGMERIRSAWNHTQNSCQGDRQLSISYHLNRLMRLCEPLDYVVTLNGAATVDDSRVLATADYTHPRYDKAAVAAQRDLRRLNSRRTAYAGSYHGWGFHEDACWSGVRAARALGVRW